MKSSLLMLALLLSQSSIPGHGVIRGKVVVAGTSEAVSDASVALRIAPTDYDTMIQSAKGVGPSFPLSVITDGTGHFSIGNLLSGRYLLKLQNEGFFASTADGKGTLTDTTAIPVTIAADQDPPEISIPVIRGAVVTGHVYDASGTPMSGVDVQAFTTASLGALPVQKNAAVRASDDRGEFRLFWLKPGEYYIGAHPNLTPTGQRAVLLALGPDQQQSTTYYPGTLEPERAVKVAVTAGETIKGLDIHIQPADPKIKTRFLISGLIINGLPPLVPGAIVAPAPSPLILLSRDTLPVAGNPPNAAMTVAAPEGGLFELPNVPRGTYDLYARVSDTRGSTGAGGNTVAWGRATVEVGNTDRTDIRIVIHASVEVKGMVRTEGIPATVFKDAKVWLEPEGTEVEIPNYVGIINQKQSFRPDGSFTVGAVAEGKYSIHVSGLADDFYVADVRQPSGSIQENGLDVNESPPEPMELVIAKGAGVIDGVVFGQDGKPAPKAAVALLPTPQNPRVAELVVNAATDEQGHFIMRSVRPGNYTLIAAASITPADERNSEYLQKAETKGVPVQIAPASNSHVQLKLD